MFFELRSYPVLPGKMEAWVRFMDEEIIPYQLSKGMCIPASFVDEENYRYVWFRRFADEAERDRQYAAVYEEEIWTGDMRPRVGEYIDHDGVTVSILRATPRSFMR
ncbi:MAG: NIPSNAP family protein [Anaerolineaceae bacterium]|nr:NIPSNAP family protein [Anaerolineaceae bacterium]MCY4024059.1 NIPSNAP family protein [Anaerolineaceae bacterium]